jgi:hypothetical protein
VLKTTLYLSLIVMLLVSTGCSGSKQPDSVASPPVQTTPREDPPASAPVKAPPIVEPKYPPPNIKIPDTFNRKQRSIAKFQNGSDICELYGREIKMDGRAIIKKYEVRIPLNELVKALDISTNYVAHDGEHVTIRTQGKTFEIPSYTVCVRTRYWG